MMLRTAVMVRMAKTMEDWRRDGVVSLEVIIGRPTPPAER